MTYSGKGITVGVLSDSYDVATSPHAEADPYSAATCPAKAIPDGYTDRRRRDRAQ